MSYQVIDSRFANANVVLNAKPFAVVAIDRLGFHQIITSFPHPPGRRARLHLPVAQGRLIAARRL